MDDVPQTALAEELQSAFESSHVDVQVLHMTTTAAEAVKEVARFTHTVPAQEQTKQEQEKTRRTLEVERVKRLDAWQRSVLFGACAIALLVFMWRRGIDTPAALLFLSVLLIYQLGSDGGELLKKLFGRFLRT